MIKNEIIIIDTKQTEKNDNSKDRNIPDWIKNTTQWWSNGLISENEFVRGLEFLINNEKISV
ncbi:MAG: hypothetical protein ACR2LL_10135 [Nitrosopumilus sp.]